MKHNQGTFNILVGIDYTEASREALREARHQASIYGRTVIHVLHALPITAQYSHGLFPDSPLFNDRGEAYALARLERFVASERDRVLDADSDKIEGRVDYVSHVREADASSVISDLARDVKADLIIVGTHDRKGLVRWLLGSVSRKVAADAPCSVLVVRQEGQSTQRRKDFLDKAHAA